MASAAEKSKKTVTAFDMARSVGSISIKELRELRRAINVLEVNKEKLTLSSVKRTTRPQKKAAVHRKK